MSMATLTAKVRVKRYRLPFALCRVIMGVLPGKYAAPLCNALMQIPRVGINTGRGGWQWQPLGITINWTSRQ